MVKKQVTGRGYRKSSSSTFRDRCHSTKLRLCIWPKKCYITGKNLWWKKAYVQSADWFGPGGIRTEHRWYEQKTFIVARLQGNV